PITPFTATPQFIPETPVLSPPNPAVPKFESLVRLHLSRQVSGASTMNSAELLCAPATALADENVVPAVKSWMFTVKMPAAYWMLAVITSPAWTGNAAMVLDGLGKNSYHA